MPYGPQEYIIDCNECIYVHDINESKDNKIIKFDSTGRYLYNINIKSITQLNNVWFGPITINPQNNNLIIFGSGTPKGTIIGSLSEIPCYFFIFSESGILLKTIKTNPWPANFLLYNYESEFFAKNVDGAIQLNSDFMVLKEIPKSLSKDRGYSQWTNWIAESPKEQYLPDDMRNGKFIFQLRNITNSKKIKIIFYNSPYYSMGGYVEGQDKNGNLLINAYKSNYVKINPETNKISFINLEALKLPKGCGDVRHAVVFSPNGNLYKACLVHCDNNQLHYQIYRISSDMFIEKESDIKTWEE
jgi:hypothetical protein